MDISQCPAILTDYGPTLGVDHVLQIVLSNILKNKINMQRCQSGRSCSLGTAVYGNVPRVQIPVSAPIVNNTNPKKSLEFVFFSTHYFGLIKKLCINWYHTLLFLLLFGCSTFLVKHNPCKILHIILNSLLLVRINSWHFLFEQYFTFP